MAVAIDVGDAVDIHPTNKQDVGKRLAQGALNQVYGCKKVIPSGPVCRLAKREGSQVRISFDHVAEGLVANGGKPCGFAIAGSDGKYVWARAKIEKDTVVIWHAKISRPVTVRYAWANNPEVNLYNTAQLPAVPFQAKVN